MSTLNKIFIITGENAAGSLDLSVNTRSTTTTSVIGVSATAAINFPKAGGGTVQLTSGASEVTFDSRALGQISFTMDTTKSGQLFVGQQVPFDVVITDSGTSYVYRFIGCLEVKALAVS